jgi:hypothetical protein
MMKPVSLVLMGFFILTVVLLWARQGGQTKTMPNPTWNRSFPFGNGKTAEEHIAQEVESSKCACGAVAVVKVRGVGYCKTHKAHAQKKQAAIARGAMVSA